LRRDGMYVHRLNLAKYETLEGKKVDAVTKVRYNDPGTPAVIEQIKDQMHVYFGSGVHAITPGQAAVFYEGEDVLGGGWIVSSFRSTRNQKQKEG
jgi:tRNA-uridine 2-sulfurtransferase